MTGLRRSILFITDELFLPRPHNGSADVYVRSAQDYARQGYEIFCVSFFRDPRRASDPEVLRGYASLFAAYLLLPGWNGGGTPLGQIGLIWREVSRWVSGNIFAKNCLLTWILNPYLRRVVCFVREHNISTVFFHKPHTLLLLANILPSLKPAYIIVDLHDDFVERELHYQRAYSAFFAGLLRAEIALNYWKPYLRYRFCRINARRSRDVETKLLAQCNEVLFSSFQEYRRYLLRCSLNGKLVHKPRRFVSNGPVPQKASLTPFHAGFIGSDDVMNLDAMMWFCREVMPRIRQQQPDFLLLVAGSIGHKAKHLLHDFQSVTIWPSLDDVATFYQAIEMLVVPLRYGTGTSTKVHEALAFGWPIVSTTVGVRGIPESELFGVSVADDPETFSTAVLERLASSDRSRPGARSPASISREGTGAAANS